MKSTSDSSVKKSSTFAVLLFLLPFTFVWGCSKFDPTRPSAGEVGAGAESLGAGSGPVFEDFDPAKFTHPTVINNAWLPIEPGNQWIYEGVTTSDGETQSHRLEFTVTDLTKEIAGVQTVVSYVVDYADGELVEKEIAFYAQDDDGNVWFFGEYPEEYEAGTLVEAPTWISGLEDAKPGLKMKAEPQLGTPSYFQGWGPGVEWTDFGQVDEMGVETCVLVDCYKDVLVIAESALDENGAFQLKYYARGVGNVRVGWRGDDETQEELQLVEFTRLDRAALADVRIEALELEMNAYAVSPDVYALTAPASGGVTHMALLLDQKRSGQDVKDPVRKISDEQARALALEVVEGEAMGIAVERKGGVKRLVVEVIAAADMAEVDVIIDMETGEVVRTER